jgi:membrane-associated phospholipid phosphatase
MTTKLSWAAALPLFVLVIASESLAQSIDTSTLQGQPFDLSSPAKTPSIDTAPRNVGAVGPWPSSLGANMGRFFTFDNAKLIGIVGSAALIASTWDNKVSNAATGRVLQRAFGPGDIAGSFVVQTGTGLATMALGKVTGKPAITVFGGDLFRAQMVSQAIVQSVKYTTQRLRPDGSNRHSFPSGHTASAFATATVIQRRFGWRAGIPAYAFGGYIAASRVAAHRHYMSDVLVGAAVGIAAGRTISLGSGKTAFDVGVGPASGRGVALTFTKK